jgi:hypothetical protein
MRPNLIPAAAALMIAVGGAGFALGDDDPEPGPRPVTAPTPTALHGPQRDATTTPVATGDATARTLERLEREKQRLELQEDLADERRDRAEQRREFQEDLRRARIARASGVPACVDTD